MTGSEQSIDLLLVGGGLANALLAYRLRQVRPELRLLVLEADTAFGGNHTWSFHATDLTAEQREWTAPFVAHRWPSYDIAFPDLTRHVGLAYCSVTSDRLHRVMVETGVPVRFDTRVQDLSPTQVWLETGEVLEARAVIDGRGATPTTHMRFGWQKFFGVELRTLRPHGVSRPILMDAVVEQQDGYRFVYTLPFGPDRLLIEDTYYSDAPDLRPETLAARVRAYAAGRGWAGAEVVREERGVLPITLSGDFAAFWKSKSGQPSVGLRAGLFHPTTGFSWPDAVRLADHLAGCRDLSAKPLFAAIRHHAERRWRERSFFRALDRMLFLAGPPESRWRIMQRFYRFDEATIARFYAGQLTSLDKLRLLVGRPPVSVSGAVRALLDTSLA